MTVEWEAADSPHAGPDMDHMLHCPGQIKSPCARTRHLGAKGVTLHAKASPWPVALSSCAGPWPGSHDAKERIETLTNDVHVGQQLACAAAESADPTRGASRASVCQDRPLVRLLLLTICSSVGERQIYTKPEGGFRLFLREPRRNLVDGIDFKIGRLGRIVLRNNFSFDGEMNRSQVAFIRGSAPRFEYSVVKLVISDDHVRTVRSIGRKCGGASCQGENNAFVGFTRKADFVRMLGRVGVAAR